MFENIKTAIISGILGLSIGVIGGIWITSWLDDPMQVRLEQPAEPERHASGALTLERNPEAPRPKPLPRAKNAETIRIITVQAPPSPIPQTIQVDIQQQADETRRVTVSSDAGEILGGVDIPVVTRPRQVPKWNIGLYQTDRPGIFALYGENRWTFGAMMNLEQEIGVMFGIRF